MTDSLLGMGMAIAGVGETHPKGKSLLLPRRSGKSHGRESGTSPSGVPGGNKLREGPDRRGKTQQKLGKMEHPWKGRFSAKNQRAAPARIVEWKEGLFALPAWLENWKNTALKIQFLP